MRCKTFQHCRLKNYICKCKLSSMKTVKDVKFKGKKVLIRVDFNVPLKIEMGVGENWLEAH